MIAKKTGSQMMYPMYRKTMVFSIWQAQRSSVWAPYKMFPHWFCHYRCQGTMLKMGWWQSIQWKWGVIRGKRQSRTEWVNVSTPGSWCCLTDNFILTTSREEWWAVEREYWLINRSIVGEMNHLARSINFDRIRATSVRILLAQLCQWAESPSVRNATNQFKSLWIQLLMAADYEWTIHENEHQWSMNNCWFWK